MFNFQEFPGCDSFLGLAGGREGVLVVWQIDTGKKKFLPRIGSPLLYFVDSPDPSLASVRKKIVCSTSYLRIPLKSWKS